MEKIRTATGKEFDCEFFSVIETPNRVYIRIVNATLAVIAQVFGDPAETVQLWYGNLYLANHNRLVAIVPEQDAVRVVLGKG